MENTEPLVAIIIVNYNGTTDTHDCVESIIENEYQNYRIIIVDNGSNREQVEQLRDDQIIQSNSIVIYEKKNGGFSEGNNIGIRYAKEIEAEYVLLLNNDTIVTKRFLRPLVECAISHDRSIVSGSIKYYSDKGKFWYAGGDYNYNTGLTTMTTHKEEYGKEYVEVSFATGCLMLIPMQFINRCGLLSEKFFLYSEDTEYCLRALRNGYKILWKPDSLIYHKVNSSTGKNSPLQQYYLTRNDLIITDEFSNDKKRSFIRLMVFCIKRIVKGDYQLRPVFDAIQDYRKGITGRSTKY